MDKDIFNTIDMTYNPYMPAISTSKDMPKRDKLNAIYKSTQSLGQDHNLTMYNQFKLFGAQTNKKFEDLRIKVENQQQSAFIGLDVNNYEKGYDRMSKIWVKNEIRSKDFQTSKQYYQALN